MADSSYLILILRQASYAVAADAVLEIFSLPELAPAAQAPPDVVGLIDLRGSIIPAVDLALRLGLPRSRYTPGGSVVVVACEGRLLGLIVDEVREVRSIGDYELQPVPDYGDAPGGDGIWRRWHRSAGR